MMMMMVIAIEFRGTQLKIEGHLIESRNVVSVSQKRASVSLNRHRRTIPHQLIKQQQPQQQQQQ